MLAVPLLFAAGTAFAAQPIAGRWLTEDGTAIVDIGNCGKVLCGKVVKLLAGPPKGPPVDSKNPDPQLRNRPLQGLVVLQGFTDQGADWRGRIYSPKEGKTYKSIVGRESDGRLKVQGCILFVCKTQHWRQAR
jgi:uncharacterized protein (DUF2147 family)